MNLRRLSNIFLCFALLCISAVTAAAQGAQVTKGALQTYATGLDRGYAISGQGQLVRTADGRTLAKVRAWGLAPNTTYAVHVHTAPCAVNNGGGHYQHQENGGVNNVNEIWPGFTTNDTGHGAGKAVNNFTARPEAQAVVIHDTDGARIACADLE